MISSPTHEVIARDFWGGTGLTATFPRDIEKAVALKLPFSLVKLSRLTVPIVRGWLNERRLLVWVPDDRREMMGCLVAYRGFGIVFICGADPYDEQRLTLAHETGHFLRDYLLPRQEILLSLGNDMAAVLDGERQPLPAERANAILTHLRLGPHVHLLPKNGRDEDLDIIVAEAEERADSLGLELVAPREAILRYLHSMPRHHAKVDEICSTLGKRFGLPPYAFRRFVQRVFQPRIVSFLDDIKPALKENR